MGSAREPWSTPGAPAARPSRRRAPRTDHLRGERLRVAISGWRLTSDRRGSLDRYALVRAAVPSPRPAGPPPPARRSPGALRQGGPSSDGPATRSDPSWARIGQRTPGAVERRLGVEPGRGHRAGSIPQRSLTGVQGGLTTAPEQRPDRWTGSPARLDRAAGPVDWPGRSQSDFPVEIVSSNSWFPGATAEPWRGNWSTTASLGHWGLFTSRTFHPQSAARRHSLTEITSL